MKKQIIPETESKSKSCGAGVVLLAAAVSAATAVAVVATYHFLQTDKGKACCAKAKDGVTKAAGTVRNGANAVVGKFVPKSMKKTTVAELDYSLDDECPLDGEVDVFAVEPDAEPIEA